MATGYPLLTIWPTNGTNFLTTYELREEGFVQIATASFAPYSTTNDISQMEYVLNDKLLAMTYRTLTGERRSLSFREARTLLTRATGPINAQTADFIIREIEKDGNEALEDDGEFFWYVSKDLQQPLTEAVVYREQLDTGLSLVVSNVADAGGGATHNILAYSNGNRTSALHPDGKVIFIATDNGGFLTTNYSTFPFTNLGVEVQLPEYSRGANVPVQQTEVIDLISKAEWSNDGRFLYAITSTNEFAIYELTETPIDANHRLVRRFSVQLPGDFQKIALRPDDRYIAISTLSGTIYRTAMYERMGYTVKELQGITNMGRALNWTGDGKYLIDATNKRCYYYDVDDNDFKEDIHLMDNIPAGALHQGISKHTPLNIGVGFIYRNATSSIIEKSIDLNNLRFALLNDTAIFDPEDVSLNMLASIAIGTLATGELITNATFGASGNGTYALSADPIDFQVDSAVSFRFGFLYDDTSNTPIAFYDFSETKSTENTVTIRINVSDFGLVTVTN